MDKHYEHWLERLAHIRSQGNTDNAIEELWLHYRAAIQRTNPDTDRYGQTFMRIEHESGRELARCLLDRYGITDDDDDIPA